MVSLNKVVGDKLGEIIGALEALTYGDQSVEQVPHTMATSIAISATSGAASEPELPDLKNSRHPFVVEEIHILDTDNSANDVRYQLIDEETGVSVLGYPARAISALAMPGVAGTYESGESSPLLRFRNFVIQPGRSLRLIAISGGTATTVRIVVRGHWRLKG